jgi:hypothetical protein
MQKYATQLLEDLAAAKGLDKLMGGDKEELPF